MQCLIAVYSDAMPTIKVKIKPMIWKAAKTYLRLTKLPPHVHLKYPKRDRTNASYNSQQIPDLFRFRSAAQLHRLPNALRLPQLVKLEETGETFLGEEIMLISLRRLSYTGQFSMLV
jgi:hypothetical protein